MRRRVILSTWCLSLPGGNGLATCRRMGWRRIRLAVHWMALFILLLASMAPGAAPELNDDNFEQLREVIRPRGEEQAFQQIGWHSSFFSAVNEARDTNQPILLWAMNGHPLGCT